MPRQLHKVLLGVNSPEALSANDLKSAAAIAWHMTRRAKSWEPPAIRLHRINEWAEVRRMSQADLVRETGIEKSTVSRWFRGAIPREDHLKTLCGVFQVDEPSDLFMHPLNDWMARLLKGRSTDEMERIRVMLEAAFPKKVA